MDRGGDGVRHLIGNEFMVGTPFVLGVLLKVQDRLCAGLGQRGRRSSRVAARKNLRFLKTETADRSQCFYFLALPLRHVISRSWSRQSKMDISE